MTEENTPRGSGRPWTPGQSGNPLGRPKGVPNKATREVKEWARRVLESKSYREAFKRRVKDGNLPPGIESLLYYYAYGKPKEREEGGQSLPNFTLQVLAMLPPEVLVVIREAYLKAQLEAPKLLEGGE